MPLHFRCLSTFSLLLNVLLWIRMENKFVLSYLFVTFFYSCKYWRRKGAYVGRKSGKLQTIFLSLAPFEFDQAVQAYWAGPTIFLFLGPHCGLNSPVTVGLKPVGFALKPDRPGPSSGLSEWKFHSLSILSLRCDFANEQPVSHISFPSVPTNFFLHILYVP